MITNEEAAKHFEEVAKHTIPGWWSCPNGYHGDRVTFQFAIVNHNLFMVHSFGTHRCPAVSTVQDEEELRWLLKHHVNFKQYRAEKRPIIKRSRK